MNKSRKVTIAVLPSPSVMEIHENENGGKEFSGYEGRFLNAILSGLGYRYEIVVPPENEFGSLKSDGNWTGMIGMVHRAEADLAFTTIAITEQRMSAVDYSVPYEKLEPSFAVKKPGDIKPMFGYVYPFDPVVWICILANLLLLSAVFAKLSARKLSYGKIVYKLYASLLSQGLQIENESVQLTILLCCWLITIAVLPASYSAALLSFITVPTQGIPIRNYRELSAAVQRGTHRCYALKGTSTINYLKKSPKDYLSSLGSAIDINKWYITDWDMKSGKYVKEDSVILSNKKKLTLFYGTNPKYIITDDQLTSWPSAFAMKKGFCCKMWLNNVVSRLVGAGLYGKFLNDESVKHRISQAEDAPEPKGNAGLSIKDLTGLFLLLAVGVLLSLISLLAEIFYSRMSSDKDEF